MYTIAPIKATKFLYGSRMPVQKALTDTFYNNGAIEDISILFEGSGYTTNQQTTIEISDTTTGTGAEAEIVSVGPNGEITEIDIIPDVVDSGDLDSDSLLIEDNYIEEGYVADGYSTSEGIIESTGEDYFAGARVSIDSSNGVGAIIEPNIIDGRIVGFDIVDAGAGYQTNDTVNITVGGAELVPVVSQSDGSILEVRIVDEGIGYASDPSLTILPTNVGTGLYGNSTAIIQAHVFEGSIVNTTIEDPGKDYFADNETTITISGDGEGATAVPIVDPDTGRVVQAIVDSGGSGYTTATLKVDGAGTGAEIEAVIGGSDISGFQSVIEQTTVDGAIYSINVTDGGEGYSSDASITIEGDGEGAEAQVVLAGGQVKEIIMTSYGSGYSYANVIVEDPARNVPGAEFNDAEAYAILPPINGHGFNAVTELFGETLAIYSTIRYTDLLDLVDQDYRQYGIIQNPRTLTGNRKLSQSSTLTDFRFQFNDTAGIEIDEILINNNVRYRVVDINGTTIRLQQLSTVYKIPTNVFFRESDPSQTYNLVNVFNAPVVNKYSGNLLYTTNRGLFEPSDDLSFTVRTFLEFKTSS